MLRIPRVLKEIRTDDPASQLSTKAVEFLYIEIKMVGAVAFEVAHAKFEKACSGPEAFAILGMGWAMKLLLQVNKCPCYLDQPFVKAAVFILVHQPEMLEHVVGLVVPLLIKTLKIAGITWIQRRPRRDAQLCDKGGDSLALFHACNFLV